MISNTDVRTADTKGLLTSNFSDNYTILGKHFSVEQTYPIASGSGLDIVIDPRLLVAAKKTFISVPTLFAVTAETVIITLGTCTSYTGGTLVTPVNRNYEFKTSNPAITKYMSGATVTGYLASTTSFGVGIKGTNQNSGGGDRGGSSIIVLDPTLIYVFRMSTAPGALVLTSNIGWFEI